MNTITHDSDKPLTVFGVSGRLTHRTTKPGEGPGLWTRQRWIATRPASGYGPGRLIKVEIRFDDECHNGHNSFAITAEIYKPGANDCDACGCLHEEIAKFFPELKPLIKWHLTGSDGPMHYIANTVYLAGNRDFHGLLKGEKRQVVNGFREGEGKELELNHARSSAVWPEATDAELSVEPEALKAALEARYPALMAEFRATMEAAGLIWSPADLKEEVAP